MFLAEAPSVVVATTFAKKAIGAYGRTENDLNANIITEVITSIYKTDAANSLYIGEKITQIQHGEQAAYFAKEDGADEDAIVAALLHDVGHILPIDIPQMEGLGAEYHEVVGAHFLDALKFPRKVCKLVESHVSAKRYLCYKTPNYTENLSEASKGTLLHQGGFMDESEAKEFERNPLFASIIALRKWDEKAKVVAPTFVVPKFETYRDMILRAVRRRLARDHYEEHGYVILRDLLDENQKTKLISWITDIQNWQPTPGKWMTYYETVAGKETLCRTENFLPFHQELRNLLTKGELVRVISELFGSSEEPCVFKEKINYKLPGGAGFPAHQDAPAFTHFGQKDHLTLNIAIDEATPQNGCLEVSPGNHKNGLYSQDPTHNGLSKEAEASIPWTPVPLKAGDFLLFSSYLPHRSSSNETQTPRRALYVTYNSKADGDFREIYYADKRKLFPQKVERIPGVDYTQGAKIYNVATPITG